MSIINILAVLTIGCHTFNSSDVLIGVDIIAGEKEILVLFY